jgi:hypothetical protein
MTREDANKIELVIKNFVVQSQGGKPDVRVENNQIHVYGDVWLFDGSMIPILIDVVHGDFKCDAPIRDLRNSPTVVTGHYSINNLIQMDNLVGAPREVGSFALTHGVPRSLEGLPQRIHHEYGLGIPYGKNLGILRVLLVKDLQVFSMHDPHSGEVDDRLEAITNRYLNRGWGGMVPCARELIKAGYKGNAKI